MLAKVRKRLAVTKQRSLRFHMERLDLKKLNKTEDKEKYIVYVTNMFAALEDLDTGVEINSAWERREYKNFSQREYGRRYRCADTSPTSLIVHLWIYTAHCSVPVTHWTQRPRAERGVGAEGDWPSLVTSSNCRLVWSLLSDWRVASFLGLASIEPATLSA
jgi:hypothetical protein